MACPDALLLDLLAQPFHLVVFMGTAGSSGAARLAAQRLRSRWSSCTSTGSSLGRHLPPASAVYEPAAIDLVGLHVKQRVGLPVSESFTITNWVFCFLFGFIVALGFDDGALGVACDSDEPVVG